MYHVAFAGAKVRCLNDGLRFSRLIYTMAWSEALVYRNCRYSVRALSNYLTKEKTKGMGEEKANLRISKERFPQPATPDQCLYVAERKDILQAASPGREGLICVRGHPESHPRSMMNDSCVFLAASDAGTRHDHEESQRWSKQIGCQI